MGKKSSPASSGERVLQVERQHVEPRQADHGLQEDPNVRPDNATLPESIERNQRRRRAALDQHERARSNTPAAPKPSVAGDAQPLSGILGDDVDERRKPQGGRRCSGYV
ncbi:MAG: hypothetical protein K0S10_1215 [Rubrobacteraceae bacterium]|nr:hypothetical protein [Rubrobacteraceae bacterium]